VRVQYGTRCLGYRLSEGGTVVALLEGGGQEEGDLLVASDGVRSPIRQQMLGDPLRCVWATEE
jgi:2-polyprenyl-6-methoxyphenol hydroxylase-like FAD-dependent oxidoreductase